MGRQLVVGNVVATTKHSNIICEVIKSFTPDGTLERHKGFLIYT